MTALNAISSDKLFRLIGTPNCPRLIDVRSEAEFALDPVLIPGAISRPATDHSAWPAARAAIVVSTEGGGDAAGAAALRRASGAVAEVLEGGVAAWREAGFPLVAAAKLPTRDEAGRTIWVTRARPKVDRIACPWLIRRFVDPDAVFLFVAPAEIPAVAEKFGAAPFDVEGVFWSHRGDSCTFDAMVAELGLGAIEAMRRLAAIVRGADTARPEIAPQAAGLLAVSLGLSRIYSDDIEQLDAGMLIYDALYRWCRDAVDETHDWVSHQPKARVPA